MPFVDCNGVRLHYLRRGKVGAPCLLLSNSLGTNLSMWQPQMAVFEQHFDVLRYDMRGHGDSSIPSGPYTIEDCGHDVLALLDGLNISSVSFCGLSVGGVIGQWLAVHASHRLNRLVLANTAAKIGNLETWNARIHAVSEHGMRSIADAVLARWFTQSFVESETPELQRMRSMLENTNPYGYIAMCAAIRDMDQRETVKRIETRTLIIAGEEDTVTTMKDAEDLAGAIHGAELVVLQAAHISNIEAAPEFTTAVLNFLLEGTRQ